IDKEQDHLYRVGFDFLHQGIKERLIGHLGKNSKASVPWLEGIRCDFSNGEVLVECHYEEPELSRKGELHFHLRSKQMDSILHEMRSIVRKVSPHNRFKERYFSPQGEPLPLEEFKERNENQQERRAMPKKVKLFISYAHEDEAYREQLDKRLRGIRRSLPLEFWHDRHLKAGELVHDKILQQLERADIVVLLISPDFVDSDYCFSHEMEVALKLYEEKQNIVIPVIIRETDDWHSFQIGNHVALPTDGKPVCDWASEDKFWADVQKGIREQVEGLT
ncbi:MAG: toll/interleukin-1 receptor domain-containing protein, partial [Thiolinea sp.]